ncbi:MAG: four helix bundle protein [Candidatus Korobacteraceae bacterium]
MRDFRQLKVWEKAHEMTLDVYRATTTFPREELFGMTSQMRRCSASVAANIAEGCGRTGNGDLYRFLNISSGSAVELEYFLLLAHDLGFVPLCRYEKLQKQVSEIQRMLASLLRSVDCARKKASG